MDLPVNAFKRALREGRKQIGLWASLCSAPVAEILAPAGYDWIMIDAEHAPNDLATVLEQLRALKGGTATPIVRPAWNDPVLIKRYLDLGVQSLLVPWVQNAAEAARAVAATRYPPAGVRGVALIHRASGYGRISDYLQRANDEMCVLVQVETREALGQLEAIAAVDGVDGIFIGPSDLSAAMGLLGGNRSPEMQTVFADAAARATRAGKPIGILAPVEEDARRFLDMGYRYVALGSDAGLLRVAAEQLRGRFPS
ncbi:MAG: 4-hydroxy-2-oxo-heptane-1,7-dioate aldolase [Acidobacteria bacterium]|nr:MAG: 4-hydroxy-2-oxo-heptane-1,7-dioate aldolase [Acidobacteriota bacterium]